MSRDEILALIGNEAKSRLGFAENLQPTHRLIEDLQLDSIRLLTLAMAVEDRFKIALDAEEEASITTVADLVALVERKLAAKELGEAAAVDPRADGD